MSMKALRVAILRRLYRVAWRALELRALVWRRRGDGVKCVLTHDGRVLLVRHTYGRRDVWYLPGGSVHRGEAPLRGAAREIEEELGLRNLELLVLATFDTRLERFSVRLTCVHAELPDPALVRADPVEIAQARWFAQTELPTPRGSEVEPLVDMLR
jgi:ADP-ribose pyrophosphatase YjhB (NUDIX family)